jgi:hypothetical protein
VVKGSPFSSADLAFAFVIAGDAVVTLRSRRTDAHFTYRVASPKEGIGNRRRFVSVLCDGDRYVYLGMLEKGGFSGTWSDLILTKGSKAGSDAPSARAFRYAWGALTEKPPRLAADLDIYHEGKCGCCGRPLTNPESIETGIGPVCAGRV